MLGSWSKFKKITNNLDKLTAFTCKHRTDQTEASKDPSLGLRLPPLRMREVWHAFSMDSLRIFEINPSQIEHVYDGDTVMIKSDTGYKLTPIHDAVSTLPCHTIFYATMYYHTY